MPRRRRTTTRNKRNNNTAIDTRSKRQTPANQPQQNSVPTSIASMLVTHFLQEYLQPEYQLIPETHRKLMNDLCDVDPKGDHLTSVLMTINSLLEKHSERKKEVLSLFTHNQSVYQTYFRILVAIEDEDYSAAAKQIKKTINPRKSMSFYSEHSQPNRDFIFNVLLPIVITIGKKQLAQRLTLAETTVYPLFKIIVECMAPERERWFKQFENFAKTGRKGRPWLVAMLENSQPIFTMEQIKSLMSLDDHESVFALIKKIKTEVPLTSATLHWLNQDYPHNQNSLRFKFKVARYNQNILFSLRDLERARQFRISIPDNLRLQQNNEARITRQIVNNICSKYFGEPSQSFYPMKR